MKNDQFTDYSFDDFVKQSRWIFAKTYAKTAPHEYTLRREFIEKDVWDTTVLYIRHFGKV